LKRWALEWIWALRRRLARFRIRPRAAGGEPAHFARPAIRLPSPTILAGDASLGYGYLDRWRRSRQDVVTPRTDTDTSLRLFSHNAPDTPRPTHPHVMAEARNLVIDFSRIGTRNEVRHRPGYLRVRGGYSDYREGALLATGRLARDFSPDLFPRDHLRDIFESLVVGEAAPGVDQTIDDPCLFITREPREYENLFHAHTDALAAFCAMRLLGLQGHQTRVVLLDPHPPGALDEAWSLLFSPAQPVARRRGFGAQRVLFRHAVFVPPGYSSVLWARQHEEVAPPPVGLIRDYGRFFGAAFDARPPRRRPEAPVQVTVLLRRPYGRRGPVLLRQFPDEGKLTAALRSIPGVSVEVADPARLSLSDQVHLAAKTEILVGAHGAGLAQAFAMAEHGAIVEIVPPPASATYRLYPNLAAWTDRLFRRIEAPERLTLGGSFLDPDVQEVRECVSDLASRVRQRRGSNDAGDAPG
jgi:Glycosyltransferase 61